MSRKSESQWWWVHAQVLPVVTGAVGEVIQGLPEGGEERCGGYFCLCERGMSWPPVIVARIGEIRNSTKVEKYFNLAQEKAKRLGDLPIPTHVSSWMSRDPDKNQWGGGIRTNDYYLAFSGLPELADEAAMLLAARRLGLLTKEQADVIAAHSNNQIFLGKEWMIAR